MEELKERVQKRLNEWKKMPSQEQAKEMETAAKFCLENNLLPKGALEHSPKNLPIQTFLLYLLETEKRAMQKETITLIYSSPIFPVKLHLLVKKAISQKYPIMSKDVLEKIEQQANSHPTYQEAIAAAKDAVIRENLECQVERIMEAGFELTDVYEGAEPETKEHLESVLRRIILPHDDIEVWD